MSRSAQISVSFTKSAKTKTDTLIAFVSKGKTLLAAGTDWDKKTNGLLSAALSHRESFEGHHGDVLTVFLPKGADHKQILLVGVGDLRKFDTLAAQNLGGKLLAALKAISAKAVALSCDDLKASPISIESLAANMAYGFSLKDYSFDKYKTQKKSGDSKKKDTTKPIALTFILSAAAKAEPLYKELQAVASSVHFSRDLVNEAPNVLYPESYAAIIKKELSPLGVVVEILDEKKMQKLGFGAHLAVGMGSIRPPRVVIMRWNGLTGTGSKSSKTKASKAHAPLAFVGKGVTFDTGGISIKPAAGMEEMKMDMGGSATVVGLIRTLAMTKAKVNVVGIVGLAENMPSDRSYRPSDIVTSLSGKTIEVLNTDAEGRLVLCDALTHIQRTDKPRMIIDLATLTGAIMVALGYEYAGTFVNNDDLWDKLYAASTATGEKLWRMPLDEAYRNEMKGSVTDLQNLGNVGRYGGACSAAGFLEQFIENDTPWAHIDIAGTAWWKSEKPTVPRGATGFGVRLLYQMVKDQYCSK